MMNTVVLIAILCYIRCTVETQFTSKSTSKSTPIGSSPRKLFFKTHPAGLFSQYLQVKLMYDYASKFNRALVLDRIRSDHYKGTVLMNEVFNFTGYNITSREEFPKFKVNCSRSIDELHPLMGSNAVDICYKGPFPLELTGETETRMAIVESLGIDFPLKLKRLELIDQLMKDLGIGPGMNFTVAHWRRGDQTTRCNSGMDASVNCESGELFVAKVRQHSNDAIVYVATNEKHMSRAMAPIRQAKFKTMKPSYHGDEFTTLALEVELMLRATTFLAWGVSEIDDVVEYERMKLGKSHCVAYEPYVAEKNVTFCYMLNELRRIPKSTMSPYVPKLL